MPGAREIGWARDTRNNFADADRAARYQRVVAGVDAAGLDRRVLQAQLRLLQVLADLAPPGAQHPRRTGLRRQLWRRHRAQRLLHRRLAGGRLTATATLRLRSCPARRRPSRATTTSPDYTGTLTADGLPFFENFYAGGPRSVRGFRDNTLGPRDALPAATSPQPLGGAVKTIGSLEMFFPTLLDTPGRAHLGVRRLRQRVRRRRTTSTPANCAPRPAWRCMWRSPMGPISISYAFPLREGRRRRDRAPAVHLRRRSSDGGRRPARVMAACDVHRRRTGRALRARPARRRRRAPCHGVGTLAGAPARRSSPSSPTRTTARSWPTAAPASWSCAPRTPTATPAPR